MVIPQKALHELWAPYFIQAGEETNGQLYIRIDMVQCFLKRLSCCIIIKESSEKPNIKIQVRDDNDWVLTITTGYFRIIKDEEVEAALVIDHIGRMRDQYGESLNRPVSRNAIHMEEISC